MRLLWVALACLAVVLSVAIALWQFPSIADHFTVGQLNSLFYFLGVVALDWVLALAAIAFLWDACRRLRSAVSAIWWPVRPNSFFFSASLFPDGPVPRFTSLGI